MKKNFYLFLFISLFITNSYIKAQCFGTLSGIIPVGPTAPASPAGFATLTAAITYINSNGLGGKTILELQSDFSSNSETFPIVFSSNPCITVAKSLTIRPSASATGLTINSSTATVTLDLNGVQNVTIDGRPGGTGTTTQLSIINGAAAGVAIRFINDASHNKINYCDIEGVNASTSPSATVATGVIFFSTADAVTLNGNDYDTLSNCNIHALASHNPAMGIVSYGTNTTVASYNDSSVITNCNVYDFFNASSPSTGIKLDVGNNAWSITNNSFYQTASRTFTFANTHRVLWLVPNTGSISNTASGFIITGNYIGGTAPLAGSTACTIIGTVASVFACMDIYVGLGAPTIVANNVITNISYRTGSTSGLAFQGINLDNGNIDCGVIGGNIIGSGTTTGAIQFFTSGTTGGFTGIRASASSGNTFNIDKNVIAGITLTGLSASTVPQFTGISVAGGTTINITNDTIGSPTIANSINIANATTNTTAQGIFGIGVSGGTTSSILNNLIANINNSSITQGAACTTKGIYVAGSTTTISGNTIRNLTSTTRAIGTGNSSALIGISVTSTAGPHLVTGNLIYGLTATGTSTTGAVNIIGIVVSTSTSLISTFSKNFIHNLSLTAANNSAVIIGFDVEAGSSVFTNNMISLGVDTSGVDITSGTGFRGIIKNASTNNNFFNNSVYIGGSGVVSGNGNTAAFTRAAVPTATPNDSLVNNIFVNNRSNGGATAKNYSMSLYTGTNFLTLSNNVYYANGTGGVMGSISMTTDVASYSDGWAGGDVSSVYGDPQFETPAGSASTASLHILLPSSAAFKTGTPLAAITDDIDGETRNLSTPEIGADEFVNVVLPVSLINFYGQQQLNNNLLYWTTATEVNSKGFQLQHSADGNVFSTLAFIASKAVNGNSNQLLNYKSIDVQPFTGDNYYRLVSIDKDGSSSYSNIVLLKGSIKTTDVINTYPNPVIDYLNIEITSKDNCVSLLSIDDINGKVITIQKLQLVAGANKVQVYTKLLSKGAYVVKIIAEDGTLFGKSLFIK